MTSISNRIISIKVDEDAARHLVLDVNKFIDEVKHKYEESKDAHEPKSRFDYFDRGRISRYFNDILKDGRIYRYESPLLYEFFKSSAGGDGRLTSTESSEFVTSWGLALYAAIKENILEMESAALLLGELASAEDPAEEELKNICNAFFVSDAGLFLNDLVMAQAILDSTIATVERYYFFLIQKESSFWNFVSAENLLGLASHITFDGSTFSSMELQGAHELLQELYSVRSGLTKLIYYVENDELNLSDADVVAFSTSPFAELAAFPKYLGDGVSSGADCDICERYKNFDVKNVQLLLDKGVNRLAYALADQFKEEFGESDSMDSVLPNAAYRFIDNEFTGFANAVASLDSVGSLAVGGAFGKLAASSLAAMATIEKASKLMWLARFVIPAVPVLKMTANSGKLANFFKIGANIAFEYGKFSAYLHAGRLIGGEDGVKISAIAYLFGAGFVSAYSTGIGLRLMEEVISGSPGKVTKLLLETGGDMEKVRAFIMAGGRSRGVKSLRLTRVFSHKEFDALFGKFTEEISRLANEAARLSEKIGGTLARIENYVGQHGLSEEVLAKAQRIAGGENKALALESLRKYLEEVQEGVRATMPKGEKVPVSYSSIPGTGRSYGSRAGGREAVRPGNGTNANGVKAVVADAGSKANGSAAQAVIQSPPERVTKDIIHNVSGGKVRAKDGALKELQRLYRENPAKRGKLLEAVRDLGDRKNVKLMSEHPQNWGFALDKKKPVYSSRVQPFRLLAQIDEEGQMWLVAARYRGQFQGWSGR